VPYGVVIAFASIVLRESAPKELHLQDNLLVIGVFAAVAMPIFAGFIGFFSGLIMALLYNMIAAWLGGIEMDVDLELERSASSASATSDGSAMPSVQPTNPALDSRIDS